MPHKRSSGFTLLEMLVTLVLFSLASSLLWQGMAWMVQVERSLSATQAFSTRGALQQEWVRQLLRGIVSGLYTGRESFTGHSEGFTCLTTTPPWPGLAGPLEVRVELARNGEQVELRAHSPGVEVLPLWSWAGEGTLDYLDETGVWHEAWPPVEMGEEKRTGRIPRAIRLRGTPLAPLLVAVRAQENAMISRTLMINQ